MNYNLSKWAPTLNYQTHATYHLSAFQNDSILKIAPHTTHITTLDIPHSHAGKIEISKITSIRNNNTENYINESGLHQTSTTNYLDSLVLSIELNYIDLRSSLDEGHTNL